MILAIPKRPKKLLSSGAFKGGEIPGSLFSEEKGWKERELFMKAVVMTQDSGVQSRVFGAKQQYQEDYFLD